MKKADMVLDVCHKGEAKYFITPMPGSAVSERDTSRPADVEVAGEAETQLELSPDTFPPLGSPDSMRHDGRSQ